MRKLRLLQYSSEKNLKEALMIKHDMPTPNLQISDIKEI